MGGANGGVVFVKQAQNGVYYIAFFSEIESVVLMGGANGGVVKVDNLVSELKKISDNLNQLKTIFTAWTPVPSDGGAALKASVLSWANVNVTPPNKNDLENSKFKH